MKEEDLGKSLDDMRDKTRQLNDSLKVLAADGLEKLAKAATAPQRPASRQNAGDVAGNEMMKFLRAELLSGLKEGMNVVINNNAGVAVTARESTDAFDRKQLEITIDQMVANSLLNGRQTSGVMRTLFGLAPGLLGR